MLTANRVLGLALALVVVATACAEPPQPGPTPGGAPSAPAGIGPKRITAAILGDPFTLSQTLNTAGTGSMPGVDEVEKLIGAGLAIQDDQGNLQPQLAEAVPTSENGLWKVLPDGRMETTWRIKDGARWHDGTPITAADLVFTLQVGQDQQLGLFTQTAYKWIEGIDAPDARTVTVRWKQPYIEADHFFTHRFALPLPKHLLEPAYAEDRATFAERPYWTTEYVGSGPYRLRDFVRSSHMVVEAYDGYILGRPRIDEIQVRFITDPNTLVANILAGEVQLTLGRGLSLEQALQVEGQWGDGKMDTKAANWIALYPQYIDPDPAIQADVRFRRALLLAIDRQQITDSLQGGRAPVAHSFLPPGTAEYREVESRIVKYPYDPQRATRLLEELGYTRGADGFMVDSAGQRLTFENRTSGGDDLREKMLFAITDYWQRVGVSSTPFVVPRQQASDREFRAARPALELVRQPFDPARYHSADIPLASNKWKGNNRNRYGHPELDALIDRYIVTIPRRERVQILGDMLHHLTDNLVAIGILYSIEAMLISDRLVNVTNPQPPEADETWNAHLWELR